MFIMLVMLRNEICNRSLVEQNLFEPIFNSLWIY